LVITTKDALFFFVDSLIPLDAIQTEKVVAVEAVPMEKARDTTLLFTLEGGMKMKCKNEKDVHFGIDILVGDIYTFYLDRTLELGYVPPAAMLEFAGRRWKGVRKDALIKAQKWKRGQMLVCSQWIDSSDLVVAEFPDAMQRQRSRITPSKIKEWSQEEQKEAKMWAGAIVLDYLAGTTDRMMQSLTGGPGWKEPVQRTEPALTFTGCGSKGCAVDNAFYTTRGHRLALVDNNSGFFYDKHFTDPLQWMLQDICIFPSHLVDMMKQYTGKQMMHAVMNLLHKHEPAGPSPRFERTSRFILRYDAAVRYIVDCQGQLSAKDEL